MVKYNFISSNILLFTHVFCFIRYYIILYFYIIILVKMININFQRICIIHL